MPIYAYQCKSCGHEFDALQKISDDPLTTCPACNEDSLKKMLTAPAFQLKGTGWYETDFKDKKAQGKKDDTTKSGNSKKEDKKSSDSSSSSKSDSSSKTSSSAVK